ncbi:MAG: hypothetical protein NW214_10185 [Pseudanabaenaceae cyanobacterium bins.39]|nr:hypothetical protein [Pseudanabaenaceae cyanobacterium bins.39]
MEKPHYTKRGKPQPDAIPTSITYRVTATVIPIDSEILAQRQRYGRFIFLATHILDSSQFTTDDALWEYKSQQSTEGNPKQPTILVCNLVDGESQISKIQNNERLMSQVFPALNLTVNQIFKTRLPN